MPHIETITVIEAYRDCCEDRVGVFTSDDRTVIAVADGAGGVGSGDIAAETVLREIEAVWPRIQSADEWADALRQIDCRFPAGESTAVVVDLRPYGIAGASVGDSEAWIITDGKPVGLTVNQNRKPLLGSGAAAPVAFISAPLDGVLLVATDGFWSYAKRDRLPAMIAQAEFFAVPRQCVDLVRLPSGALWDDIGIVAARIAPRQRARTRYSL